jgi:hypothetical protein
MVRRTNGGIIKTVIKTQWFAALMGNHQNSYKHAMVRRTNGGIIKTVINTQWFAALMGDPLNGYKNAPVRRTGGFRGVKCSAGIGEVYKSQGNSGFRQKPRHAPRIDF